MVPKIRLFSRLVKDLEKIASIVFPMEIEAAIPLLEIDGADGEMGGVEIELPCDLGHPKAYTYSETFESLVRCLKSNCFPDFYVEKLVRDYEESKRLFQKFKECQRKRKMGECELETVSWENCGSRACFGQPGRPNMYDWISAPSVVWHSHLTSVYGDVTKLSVPSDNDTAIVKRRMALQRIPIMAEGITCTSETGEQRTRFFCPPPLTNLLSVEERTEINFD